MLQALFDLTVEKGYEAVSISDIASRANVNRSTFYRHYLDKGALLAEYLAALQVAVTAVARQQTDSAAPPAGLLLLLRHIRERADFYRVMLGPQGDAAFVHRLRQISAKRYRDLFARVDTPAPDGPPTELRVAYISQATIGAITWWLSGGRSWSPEKLAGWLGDLSLAAAGLDPRAAMRRAPLIGRIEPSKGRSDARDEH